MKRFLVFIFFVLSICDLAFCKNGSQRSSHVFIKQSKLYVSRANSDGSLEGALPFVIRGVSWSAATRAPDLGPNPDNRNETVPYGFFFDWPNRHPQGHVVFVDWMRREYFNHYREDIPLMKEMNVNTVRVYTDFGLDFETYREILDDFYRNGIMVIMTVASSKEDIETERYLKIVESYKNHPAILFWLIGNEWNLSNLFWGYESVSESAAAVELVAGKIKEIDSQHPVSSCLGDKFFDDDQNNTIASIVESAPTIDVWGLNIYRGKSFGTLFDDWRKLSPKPFYISEFGTDSFKTEDFLVIDEFKAYNCKGYQDQEIQAEFAIGLLDELKKHLSINNDDQQCLGALVHEFNDSLWKVGSYHADLGGLVDYNSPQGYSYRLYNSEGFYLSGSHPDKVANEEYFGVVTSERKPKKIYYELKEYYKE